MKSLKETLGSSKFVLGVELVTTRGTLQRENKKINIFAHQLMDSKQFDFISITDNPGGNPKMAPETIGSALIKKGHVVNIHMTCKDRNRNALEMRAWRFASEGCNNLLALSGDFPTTGYRGSPRPVYDIDSVVLIKMLKDMNKGFEVPGRGKEAMKKLSSTNFFIAATVSPFKKYEAEYITQLFKMEKKIRMGADYFIIQVGYDSRKWAELLTYMKMKHLNSPMIALIYMLSKPVARIFNKGLIPGCNVSDEFLEIISKQTESPDKGEKFFLEFAAKQWAIAKGLGYKGVYFGGIESLETYRKIKKIEKSFSKDDWKSFYKEIQYPLPDELYLFKTDNKTGLPETKFSERYKKSIGPGRRIIKRIFLVPPIYRLCRVVHVLVFNSKSPFYHMMRIFYRLINRSRGLSKFFHFFEHTAKRAMFGCHDCGDCSLMDVAYLCPEEKCSKNQRNGPCGGSHAGICEVDDKKCIWFKAYNRLFPFKEEKKNFDKYTVITNGRLFYSSGWQNFFLDKDHTSILNKKL